MAGHVDEASALDALGGRADHAALGGLQSRRRRATGGRQRLFGPSDDRGPAVSMRRDTIFRRSLLGADALSILCALALTVALSAHALPLRAGIEGLAVVPLLLLGAKLTGLYDRDETLLRKTTLDEAPKLFQLATLCALAVWLGGSLVLSWRMDRQEALLLWPCLAALLIVSRALARMLALRISPTERCLFIGDERGGRMVAAKLVGHSGINASIVAHIEMDQVAAWSTDAFSAPRLAEIRDLARTLDVHRAIIAPGWGADADAGETLNLV
ncbi:MAG TPA: hypothetical protein VH081_09725, partial [Solirubrobacteraceae bacterium]|nr:hypothetical protein [Solirubrobacteraceae bacterium]